MIHHYKANQGEEDGCFPRPILATTHQVTRQPLGQSDVWRLLQSKSSAAGDAKETKQG
jgi:hypothetical protein